MKRKNIENNFVDSEFPFYTDKSCNDQPCNVVDSKFPFYTDKFTKFNVPSNSMLDEEMAYDQHILDQYFHNYFLDLVTDHLFQCEEFSVSGKSDVISDMTAKRQGSDFMYPSHLDTQGELYFLDICNLVNKVEYEYFMFPLDSMHPSYVHDNSQFDFYILENADLQFHNEQGEENMSSFYIHYESDDDSFVLPNEVIERSDVLGKTKKNKSFSLP